MFPQSSYNSGWFSIISHRRNWRPLNKAASLEILLDIFSFIVPSNHIGPFCAGNPRLLAFEFFVIGTIEVLQRRIALSSLNENVSADYWLQGHNHSTKRLYNRDTNSFYELQWDNSDICIFPTANSKYEIKWYRQNRPLGFKLNSPPYLFHIWSIYFHTHRKHIMTEIKIFRKNKFIKFKQKYIIIYVWGTVLTFIDFWNQIWFL